VIVGQTFTESGEGEGRITVEELKTLIFH